MEETTILNLDKFLAGALAASDQMEAWYSAHYDDDYDEGQDDGIELLRSIAGEFDEFCGPATLRIRDVQRGIVIAARFFDDIGLKYSCCAAHGDHIRAVAHFLASTLVREPEAPVADDATE